MNAIQSTIIQLPLDALTLDADLQPRAKIDEQTQQEYISHLAEGGTLPAVLVIHDGEKHYLVDGYHRWHAHRALGLCDIAAEVRVGNALDAVTASLRANAEHGKRRVAEDYRRGYQIAVNYKLVAAANSEAVAAILRCSERWARELTADARERERILRDEAIRTGKAEGKSNRQVAKEVGIDEGTVRNVTSAENRKPSVSPQLIEADPSDPRQLDIEDALKTPSMADLWTADQERKQLARENLASMESPEVREWHHALEALRRINAMPAPAALFLDRYRGFDHALGDELRQAREWINDMHRRFFGE